MADVFIHEQYLTDIADAIRTKLDTEDTYKPSEMAEAIESISGGGITPTGTKQISVTQNGTTTEDVTNYADAEITVNVPTGGGSPVINPLSVIENGTYTAPSGVDGYSPITVNVSGETAYGKPLTMVMHAGGEFPYSGVNGLYWDVNTSGTNNTRRSIWQTSGTHKVKIRKSSSDMQSEADLYPIDIPSGASKVSISAQYNCQAIIFFAKYDSYWVQVSNTGWASLPVQDYALPSGATNIFVGLRVNSSNANFAYNNQPYYVEIDFS